MTSTPEIETQPLAAQVTATVAEVLADSPRVDLQFAPDTPLARYGLDSMQAARLALEIEGSFGVPVPMEWFANGSTTEVLVDKVVEQLLATDTSDLATGAGPARPAGSANTPDPAGRHEPFGLLPLQEAYLVGKQAGLDPVGCHLYREFALTEVDPDRVRAAWQRLVDHHDMLRTVVEPDGRQRVMPTAPAWTMPVHEVHANTFDELRPQVEAVRERLSHRRYEPGEWPMYTVEVTRGSGGPAVVHLSIDALVTDGHGLNLLLDQWWRCYSGNGPELAEPELSVRDCVLAIGDRHGTPAYTADLDYWRDRLRDLPPGPQVGSPDAAGPPGDEATAGPAGDEATAGPAGGADLPRVPLDASLPADEWARLRALARSREVSPTALVLTLFAEALGGLCDDGRFSLNLTVSERMRLPATADALVGPFTSTIVAVAEPSTGLDRETAYRQTHERLWQDLSHAGVSGVQAMRALRRDGIRPATGPQVVFTSMLDLRAPATGFAERMSYAVSQTSGVALDHQMWEQGGDLRLHWDVAPDLFPTGWPKNAFARFCNALHAAAEEAAEQERPAAPQPLNDLQQAYFVSRAAAPADGWTGCQMYHSFRLPSPAGAHAPEQAVERLESAWLSLVDEHPALRTTIAPDGIGLVRPTAPSRWHIPLIDLTDLDDPDAALGRIRDELTGRAFPLGRGRHAELRLVRDRAGLTVHLAVDLIVLDARSIQLLFRELLRRYTGDPVAATEPTAQPAATQPAATQPAVEPDQDQLDRAAAVRYWHDRLTDLPPGPRLHRGAGPAGASTEGGPTSVGATTEGARAGTEPGERRRVRVAHAAPHWRRFADWTRAQGLSPDSVLFAAFTETLAERFPDEFSTAVVRWSDASERYRPGELTALSWLARGTGDLSLRERAEQYQRTLDADARADTVAGLGQLRRLAGKERDPWRYAFPVVYTCVLDLCDHPLPAGVTSADALTCTPDVSLDNVTVADGDTLHIGWDAVSDDLPEPELSELFAAYLSRLAPMLADEPAWPDQPVAASGDGAGGPGRLSEAERHKIIYEWNATRVDFPAEGPVHLLFEEQARVRPDATAVCWSAGSMTYDALNRYANRIAWCLKDAGVGPETPVAISSRRGPDMIAAVFGVLKAGGIYVPVEPSLPRERATTMITDAGAPVLLATADTLGWPAPPGVRVIEIDTDPVVQAESRADTNPEPVTTPDNTAYFIFTSGSTGRPKCVAVAHRPVLNLLNWCYRMFHFGPHDLGLCVTSLGFDLSVFDILGLLGRGAGLYVANEAQQRDPELLVRVLLDEGVTFWNSAPTTLHQLAPLLPSGPGEPGTDALRLVFLSGDYTPLTLPDALRAAFPQVEVVSLGGATEATVWSNYFPVGDVDPEWRSIPYGWPIDNSRYYILDEHLEPCPVEVEGDLYIAGDCLSLGYRGQPELTAERFPDDPFAAVPGEKMYRTGDRASYFPDGTICFLGRADHQVKIRGFRVELGEIEHRLQQHPGVRDAVVLARPDATGDRKVVAYIVAGDPAPTIRELRAHAAETLPAYMVPNFVAFLPAFPATRNGKLDRDALPWPLDAAASTPPVAPVDDAVPPVDAAPAAPAPPVDDGAVAEQRNEAVAALFAELIGVDSIEAEQDLWDQGATSFTMVRASAELLSRYGQRLPVSVLLAEPTAAAIARHLGEHVTVPAAPALSNEEPAPVEPVQVADAAPVEAAVPPVLVEPPAAVDFFSPAERANFKAAGWSSRRKRPDAITRPLVPVPFPDADRAARATRREYLDTPVPYASLSRLLGLLRQVRVGDRGCRLYPSAGDTYAVQVYLHVKPGRVADLAGGLYYYRPEENALELVRAEVPVDPSAHFYYNRAMAEAAAFELYLVGQKHGIEPLYGEQSQLYLALEAGYLGQTIMSGQAASGIGLCPVGALAFDGLAEQLELDDGHCFLHAFVGGAIAPAAAEKRTGNGRWPEMHALAPAPVQRNGHNGRPKAPAPPARSAPPPPAAAPATGTPPAGPSAAPAPRPAARSETGSNARTSENVAVIGMSGRYPGADDLDEWWNLLSAGRHTLGPLPAHRAAEWRATAGDLLDPEAVTGGFLADVDSFDSLLFRIAPAEVPNLDPQLRLLLPAVWECLEDAGHTPRGLDSDGHRVGVFVGSMWHDFQHTGSDRWRSGQPAVIAAVASDLANRISHAFGFRGPSLAVDTSCSSSVTALHLAVQSLQQHECDTAVVAAANLFAHPYHLAVLSGLGMVALDGTGGAFDSASTGWAPGEGVAALLLRRDDDARSARDVRHGIVESTWLGHVGPGSRYAAPNPDALAGSLREALARAGLTPADIGYVECAAGGARLSDAAEAEALGALFRDSDSGSGTGARQPVPIGTVKPNIGHLEAASGLSQLVKVLLQLRYGRIVPTLATGTDGLVSWADLPVRIADRLTGWHPVRPGAPLRALVNAVGATGSFGHVVLRGATD